MRTINRFDDLEFSQRCKIMDDAGMKYPLSEEVKQALFDNFKNTLPKTREIKSTNEISIGDTLMYTGDPRGTGMFVPELGQLWEMKTEEDLIHASIEIIERGRGWRPLEALTPCNTKS